ncbi:MAG: extracellular solute-binding protein [Christensenellales bacterium]|jgi:putative aldouronate transport system substrate-binding protein
MKKQIALLVAVLCLFSTAFALADVNKEDFHYFENGVTLNVARVDGFSFYGYNEDWTSKEDNLWIKKFKEYLNIDFEYAFLLENNDWETYNTQLNLAIASGMLPTACSVNRAQYEELIEGGYMADMSEMYAKYASDHVKSMVEDSPELNYMTRDGKLYGLPVVSPTFGTYDMLVIRKDWMDAIGVTEVPTTIEGMIELGEKFVEAKLGGENTYALCVGGAGMGGSWGGLQGFFMGYGVPWVSNNWQLDETTGKLYYGPTDARMKEALLRLQEMYKVGLIKEDYLVTGAAASFNAGEAGIIYSINYGPINAVDLYALDEKVELIGADIPTLNGEKPIYYDSAIPGSFLFVNANATEEEKRAIVEGNNLTQALFSDFSYDWGYHRGASPLVAQNESPYMRVLYYGEIAEAYETGNTDHFTSANAKTYYERLVAFEAGDRSLGKYHGIYRVPDGTYGVMYRALQEDRMRNTLYVAPSTESMLEYQGMLDELLVNAANNVIMGQDISVWEAAVDEWYATGGQEMTDDVNEWFELQ